MSEERDLDPELAQIRARRMEELLAGPSARTTPPVTDPTPVPLHRQNVPTFLAQTERVVIDVWAPWCAPCRAMAPTIDALARELSPSVRFGKLNADEEPQIAAQWNVTGIPTLLLFERGRLADRVVGLLPREALRRRLQTVFRLDPPGGAPGRAA